MYQNEKSPLRLYKEWAHSQIPAFKTLQMGQLRQFRGSIPITAFTLERGAGSPAGEPLSGGLKNLFLFLIPCLSGSAAWRSSLEKMIQSAQSPPESGLAVRTAGGPT